jgi:hypothetical protein
VLAWLFQLGHTILRILWPFPRDRARAAIDVEDAEEKLWAITLEPKGQEERLVAVIAGTRAEAQDVGNSAAGMYVLQTGEVFMGRYGVEEMDVHSEATLRFALRAAVPLWIGQLRTRPWAEVQARGAAVAPAIVSTGAEFYRGADKGARARAFIALSEALAILAFAPGGVRAFGLHFEAKHGG